MTCKIKIYHDHILEQTQGISGYLKYASEIHKIKLNSLSLYAYASRIITRDNTTTAFSE